MLKSSVLSITQIGRVAKHNITTFDQVQVRNHISFNDLNTLFRNTINLCINTGVLHCLGTDVDKDAFEIVLFSELFKYT